MSLFGGGKQETNVSSWLVPWGPARMPLEAMMEETLPAFDKAHEAANRGTPDDFIADLTETQRQALTNLSGSQWTRDAANTAAGIGAQGQQLAGQGGQTLTDISQGNLKAGVDQDVFNQFYNEDLLNQQIDAAGADIRRNLNEGEMLNIDRQYAGMGGAGSSRAGIAEGVAIRGAQDRLTDTGTALRSNMFNNALGNAAQFGQNNFGAQQNAAQQILNTGGAFRQDGMNSGATYGQNTVNNMMQAGGTEQAQAQQEIEGILAKQQADIGLPMAAIQQGTGITAPVASTFGFNRSETEQEGGGGGIMGMISGIAGNINIGGGGGGGGGAG